MNGCQHTDELMNGYEEAVSDNIDNKSAKKQKERGGGGGGGGGRGRKQPK